MGSFLSTLRDICLPSSSDASVAFDFGRDVAHEYLALYQLIDNDKDSITMSQLDKYVSIVAIQDYYDSLDNNPTFAHFMDRLSQDLPRTGEAVKSLHYTQAASMRITMIVQWANKKGLEFNFNLIACFMAAERFMSKYKKLGDHCQRAIFAGVADVIPPTI